jgi:hypothetical protein
VKNAFLFLFGGVWLLVGAGFLVGGLVAYRLEERYRAEGQPSDAIVLEKSIDRARRGTGNRRSTDYRVRYRFTTADGRTVEGSDSVDVGTWEALEERGPIRVRYLPDSPDESRVDAESDRWVPLILAGVGLVLTPVGGVILATGWRQWRTHRRLRAEGAPAEAIVTAVHQTRVSVNRVRQWRIRYRYRDHLGQTHEGKSGYLSPDEVEEWREGDRGAVRFDRNRPDVSVWLGRRAAQGSGPDDPSGDAPAPVEPR